MKKINEYFQDKELTIEYLNAYNVVINRDVLLEIIEQIREDTIRETVKECAEVAELSLFDFIGSSFKKFPQGNHYAINDGTYVEINTDEIISVADKLIKEL